MYHRCLFSMRPKIMVMRGALEATKWLSSFPASGVLSTQYNPSSIILGRPLDYESHCQISFGSYEQAYTRHERTNTPKERTTDTIFLRTMDTIQGGYEVMDLQTSKLISRFHVTEIPMPPSVRRRVEAIAKRDGFTPHNEHAFHTYAFLAGVDNPPNSDDSEDNSEESEVEDESYNEGELNEIVNYGLHTPGAVACCYGSCCYSVSPWLQLFL
jgi:hypothetical protein